MQSCSHGTLVGGHVAFNLIAGKIELFLSAALCAFASSAFGLFDRSTEESSALSVKVFPKG